MTFTIRPYDIGDSQQLGQLFSDYLTFYETAHDPDEARRFITARAALGDSTVIVAELESGELAGFTQLYPTYASLSLERAWTLYDLYFRPQDRRSGVAGLLLKRAAELGRETGASVLTLETAVDNHLAMQLYESLGWTRETEFYGYYLDPRQM